MFSKWIIFLLKCFDWCGFYPETSNKSKHYTFIIQCVWAITLTIFIIAFLMQPILLNESLPYIVNIMIQTVNGMITHWVIIVESFVQRKKQRTFWKIYEHIAQRHKHCKNPVTRLYSIFMIQYLVVVTSIQIFFMSYYISYVGDKWYFRIAYLVSQTMYQYRLFYYFFYLELVKFELKTIKRELKDIADLTHFHITFVQHANRRNKRGTHQREFFYHSTVKGVNESNLKRINAYCQLVYELSGCINQTFGWSNFSTILYSFHLPLTDGNWALWELHERTLDYVIGWLLFFLDLVLF